MRPGAYIPHIYPPSPSPGPYGLNSPGPSFGSDPTMALLAEFDKPPSASHTTASALSAAGLYQPPSAYYGYPHNARYSAHSLYHTTTPFPGSSPHGPGGHIPLPDRSTWNPHTGGPVGISVSANGPIRYLRWRRRITRGDTKTGYKGFRVRLEHTP